MIFFIKILIGLFPIYSFFLFIFYAQNDFINLFRIDINWYHDVEKNVIYQNRFVKEQGQYLRNFFYNQKNLVYYDDKGETLHKVISDSKTLIAPDTAYYSLYNKIGTSVDFFNNQGDKQWSLDTYGFPVITPFRKNVIFFSSDHNTITIYDYNRNLVMPAKYLGTLITDYSICQENDGIIFGNMEGDVFLFDNEGEMTFQKNFAGSRYNYVKTVACSKSGEYLAVLAGLYPEQLILMNQQGTILWNRETDQDRRTRANIFIDENNGFVFDRQKNDIQVFSLASGENLKHLAFPIDEYKEIKRLVFDHVNGWFLLGVSGELSNKIIFMDQTFQVLWIKDFFDDQIVFVELKHINNRFFFLIHSSTAIYSYQLTL